MDRYFNSIRTIKDIEKYENIVLFGAGKTSEGTIKLLKHKKITCFFDNDSNKWGKEIEGYKIYSPVEIGDLVDDKTAIVISTISYQYEIANDLVGKYNIKENNVFSYTNHYCEKFIYDISKIIKSFDRIIRVIDLLEDNESKDYVRNSVICRLTRNPLYLKENRNIKIPYEYSNIVLSKKGDAIIDCGAYIGDTAELFLKKLEGQAKIYCIEAFKSNYDKLCDNIRASNTSDKVKCINIAISDEKRIDVIRCNEDEVYVNANLRNKQGKLENKIRVDKIDNLFNNAEKIDFIKMDIEGEEVNALNGAHNVINKMKPNMVISAYHLVEHMWEIPETIRNINQSYEIFAGHQPRAPFEIEFYMKYDNKELNT